MEEKRKSKRMDIDVHIQLKAIEGSNATKGQEYEVDVINVSRGGIGFRCSETLAVGDYYDIQIVIWTKERIDGVIKIIRYNDGVYGGQFIGLSPADSMKIEIYELFNYPDDIKK